GVECYLPSSIASSVEAACEAQPARGYRVVPEEPTEAMLRAVQKAQCDHSSFEDWLYFSGDDARRDYAAMLTAATKDAGQGEARCAECGVELELVRPCKQQHPTCSQHPAPTEAERLAEALECLIIGACAVAVPHNGERAVLQDAL